MWVLSAHNTVLSYYVGVSINMKIQYSYYRLGILLIQGEFPTSNWIPIYNLNKLRSSTSRISQLDTKNILKKHFNYIGDRNHRVRAGNRLAYRLLLFLGDRNHRVRAGNRLAYRVVSPYVGAVSCASAALARVLRQNAYGRPNFRESRKHLHRLRRLAHSDVRSADG
jgi:hypothetical protein